MRKRNLIILSAVLVLYFWVSIPGQAEEVEQPAVQGAMENFIRGKLAAQEGRYDIKGVKEKDASFVSCADFKAGNDIYDVDYYVKKVDGKYLVVKELFHKKNGEAVNEVMWQQD